MNIQYALKIVILATVILTGCQFNSTTTPPTPTGAIEIVDGAVWMVPAGYTENGCKAYTKWSHVYLVDMAIYYRTKDGGFTNFLDEANCQ